MVLRYFRRSLFGTVRIVFDHQMSMSDHVTQLCKSINWLIRNISRIRPYIDFDTCHNTGMLQV